MGSQALWMGVAAVVFGVGVALGRFVLAPENPGVSGPSEAGEPPAAAPDPSRERAARAEGAGASSIEEGQAARAGEVVGVGAIEATGELLVDVDTLMRTDINDFEQVRQLYNLLATADADELEALMDDLSGSMIQDMTSYQILGGVLSRWAAVDPAGAFAHLREQEGQGGMMGLVGTQMVLMYWVEEDPEAAFAALEQVESRQMRDQMRGTMLYTLATTDPAAAMARFNALPQTRQSAHIRAQIFAAWAINDPSGAMAEVRGLPAAQQRPAMESMLQMLAFQDADKALALLDEVPEAELRDDLERGLVQALSWHQPMKALEVAERTGLRRMDPWQLGSLLGQVAGEDPARAVAVLETLPLGEHRLRATEEIAQNWALEDPEAVLAWAENFENANLRNRILAGAIDAIAAEDPARAAVHLERMPMGDARDELVSSIIQTMSESNPEQAIAFARNQLQGREQLEAIGTIAGQLAVVDRGRAVALIDSLPMGEARENAMYELVGQWAQGDFDGALDWVLGLADAEERRAGIDALEYTWIERDPEGARAFIRAEGRNETTESLLNSYASEMAGIDPRGTLAFIADLGWDEHAESAMRTVFNTWSDQDPLAAIDYIEGLDEGTPGRGDFVETALRSLARNDPEAAVAWAGGFEEEAERAGAYHEIIREWMRVDSVAASEWVSGLPDGPARDAAIAGLADSVADSDPEAGLSWVLAMSDPRRRLQEARSLLRHSFDQEPGRARLIIEESTLSAAEKAELAALFEEN